MRTHHTTFTNGLNLKGITAYLKEQAKSTRGVRLTCENGSVYVMTGYVGLRVPSCFYREFLQPITLQPIPDDGITLVSSAEGGFERGAPNETNAALLFKKCSYTKERIKRTSIIQEVEVKQHSFGFFRMYRNGSTPIMINTVYDNFITPSEFTFHGSDNPHAPILATNNENPQKASISVLIAPIRANDEIQQICNRMFS